MACRPARASSAPLSHQGWSSPLAQMCAALEYETAFVRQCVTAAIVSPGQVKRYKPCPGRRTFRILETCMSPNEILVMEACIDCAAACNQCLAACLGEADVAAMSTCVALDIDCAAMCVLAAGAIARGSSATSAICGLCAELCDRCGQECGRHPMEHCLACAQACQRCARECRGIAV